MSKNLKPKTNPFDEALQDGKKKPYKAKKPSTRGRGRPRVDKSLPTALERFTMWLPHDLLETIKKQALEKSITYSQHITNLLKEGTQREAKSLALIKLEALQDEEMKNATSSEEMETIMKKYEKLKKRAK